MLKQIGSVFSFLTIIPTSNSDLNSIAKNMFLFPIVGIVIGLIVGSLGYGLSLYLEPIVVSLIVVASLAVITGIHHTDGLADFSDGLMTKGTKEKKTQSNEGSFCRFCWNIFNSAVCNRHDHCIII